MDAIFPFLEKILVFDTDTIINGSIIDLWETNIEKYVLPLVPEVGLYGKISSSVEYSILFEHNIYYNSGVLLFNLKKWRVDNINELIISGIKTYIKSFKIFTIILLNDFFISSSISLVAFVT